MKVYKKDNYKYNLKLGHLFLKVLNLTLMDNQVNNLYHILKILIRVLIVKLLLIKVILVDHNHQILCKAFNHKERKGI
jgi:hypothetical protein